MIYGLYLSAQGAQQESSRMDVVANNLANASTSGFKRDLALFQAHRPFDLQHGTDDASPERLHAMTGGMSLADVVTDFRDGPAIPTGGTFDVALSGKGFLRVDDGGRPLLTRDGRLAVNSRRQLVTQEAGRPVLDPRGQPIVVPADAHEVEIAHDGSLWSIGAAGQRAQLGQLDLVQPRSPGQMRKVGNNFFQTEGGLVPAADVQVRQGFLEGSGVNPVGEMLEMIQASRNFETNVNMIRFQDEALGQLLQMASR